MNIPDEYYQLATPRIFRRHLKNKCRKIRWKGCRCSIILKDENGTNMLKSRLLHGRLKGIKL